MLHTRLARFVLWSLALNMLVQPILVALPPNIISGLGAGSAIPVAHASDEEQTAEPLTAIVPAPDWGEPADPPEPFYPEETDALGPDSRGYFIREEAGEHRANNRRQNIDVRFTPQGLHIRTRDGGTANLHLTGYGYESAIEATPGKSPVARDIRVNYQRGNLVEWYVNGASGLEQGFTLQAPPDDGSGELIFQFKVSGSLRPTLVGDGSTILFEKPNSPFQLQYTGLKAFDAAGNTLPSYLSLDGDILTIHVDDTNATYPVTIDPIFVEFQKLIPPVQETSGRFGNAVAIDGNTAIVGAPYEGETNQGSAYVYVKTASGWGSPEKLTVEGSQRFGWSVDVEGNTIVVGSATSIYLFVPDITNDRAWKSAGTLTIPGGLLQGCTIEAVAISGNRIVIGAPCDRVSDVIINPGSVHVFGNFFGSWTYLHSLSAADHGASFGTSLAIEGDDTQGYTLIVGAPDSYTSELSGRAFIYQGISWDDPQILQPDDLSDEHFGSSVGLSGDTIAVGALSHNYMGGAIYTYSRGTTIWVGQDKLEGQDYGAWWNDYLLRGLAIEGEIIASGAGARGDSAFGGTVFVLARDNGEWTFQQRLDTSDYENSIGAMVAVDITRNGSVYTIIAGNGSTQAAYIFNYVDDHSPTAYISGGGTDWPVVNNIPAAQGWAGNPINTLSGNQTFETVDLEMTTPAGPIYFSRSYSSFNAYYNSYFNSEQAAYRFREGALGPGWVHDYETRLIFCWVTGLEDGTGLCPDTDLYRYILLLSPGGSRLLFTQSDEPDKSNLYLPQPGVEGKLERINSNFVYTNAQGVELTYFDEVIDPNVLDDGLHMGMLSKIDYFPDGEGVDSADDKTIELKYYSSADVAGAPLQRVATNSGTFWMDFYYTEGLIFKITTSDSRNIYFGYELVPSSDPNYNSLSHLTAFTDVRGKTWRYGYATSTTPELDIPTYPYFQNFMTSRRDPLGRLIVQYKYEMNSHRSADAPAARAFQEMDAAGNPIVTVDYYGVVADPILSRVHFGEVSPVDTNKYVGPMVDHVYHGVQLIREAVYGLEPSSTYYAPGLSRPSEVIRPNVDMFAGEWTDQTTRYDWAPDPSFPLLREVVDALNQSTFFYTRPDSYLHTPEIVLNADGTYTKFIYNTPTIIRRAVTCVHGQGCSIPDSDLSQGPLSNPFIPAGYSVLPHISEQTLIARIESYDPYLPNDDPRQNLTRYYYYRFGPAMGLLQAIDDPGKAGDTCYQYDDFRRVKDIYERCQFSFDPVTLETTIVEGKHTVITYDTLGRVASVTDPMLRQTTYEYEGATELPRLVTQNYKLLVPMDYSVQDANGDVWNIATRYYYDAAGRLVGVVENYDPTAESGTLAGLDFDGDGTNEDSLRLDSAQPHANRATKIRYDSVGRVVETITNYDGSDLSIPANYYRNGQYNFSTYTVYDGAGRVSATIENYTPADPSDGLPPASDFDGDGFINLTREDTPRIVVSPNAPDRNRVTLYRYNSVGRLELTISPAWLTTSGEVDYYTKRVNTQGQSIVYNRVTVYEYDIVGNVTKTVVNYQPNLTDLGSIPGLVVHNVRLMDAWRSVTVDPDQPEYNQITCIRYDKLNRPILQYTACVPGQVLYYQPARQEHPEYIYNLVTYFAYDEMGRRILTVENYEEGPRNANGSITLPITQDRNHVTRIYYDDLGRTQWVIREFVGDTTRDDIPNVLNDLLIIPDHNLITRYYYNTSNQIFAVVENYREQFGPAEDPQSVTQRDQNLSEAEINLGLASGYNFVTRYYYNSQGLVRQTVDNFIGHIVAGTHDPFTSSRPDVNLVTDMAYDALGRPTQVTLDRADANDPTAQIINTQIFDNLGRVTQTIFDPGPFEHNTWYDYVNMGFEVTTEAEQRDGELLETLTTYDVPGNPQHILDPGGLALTEVTKYDLFGRPTQGAITHEDGRKEIVTTAYDPLGQPLRVTRTMEAGTPDLVTTYTYTLAGQVQTVAEQRRNDLGQLVVVTTRYEYDHLGQLLRVIENYDAANPSCATADVETDQNICTQYQYDAIGSLTTITLGNGTIRKYQYDGLGRLTFELSDPGGEALFAEYCYDAASNVIRTIRGRGRQNSGLCADETGQASYQIAKYTYDALGHPKNIDYSDLSTSDVAYWYDRFGNRERMQDANNWTYSFRRDGLLETTALDWADPNRTDYQVSQTYDEAGNRRTLSFPGLSEEISYYYDTAGRLNFVTNPFVPGYIYDYDYDEASRVTDVTLLHTLPEPVTIYHTEYDYDLAGRLQNVTHGAPGSLSSFTYAVDPRGNRTDAHELLPVPASSVQGVAGVDPSTGQGNEPGATTSDPALALPAGLHQETDPRISYAGAWQNWVATGPNGGSTRYTNELNATASFTFDGTGFTLYRLLDTTRGLMEVCIDAACQMVDNYSATQQWNQPVTFGEYAPGIHSVTLRNAESKYMDVDAVEVLTGTLNTATPTNTSTPTITPTPTALPVGLHQETDSRIAYSGTWQNWVATGPNGGSTRYTNQLDATASFSFDGTGFTLYRLMNDQRGLMEVCIDGACQTVNNYSATQLWNQPVTFGEYAPGIHSVTIRNAESKYMDVDAVEVLTGTLNTATPTVTPTPTALPVGLHQETDPRISYAGTWLSWVAPQPNGGSTRYTNELNATASFQFNGAGFTLYRLLDTTRGLMEVCIDGACQTVNNYSATQLWNQPVTFGGYAPGVHSVTIRHATVDKYLDVDAIEVFSDAPTPTATATETATATPTETPLPTATETSTATETPTVTPTDTATATPTDTATPTATYTVTYTPSPTATETALPTDTPVPTDTPSPTATPTPTPAPPPPEPEGEYRWRYTYDGLGRLTYACSQWDGGQCLHPNYEFRYAYDGAGNLRRFTRWDAVTHTPVSLTMDYNGANQLTRSCTASADNDCADADDQQVLRYQYDATGSLDQVCGQAGWDEATRTCINEIYEQYTHDGAGRLTQVNNAAGITTYEYNGDGDRISQTVNGVRTDYILDVSGPLTNVLAETTTTGGTTAYLYGLSLLAQQRNGATEYPLADGLGSVRQVLDGSATAQVAQTFDPYGNLYARSVGDFGSPPSFGYTGEPQDPNGLTYLRARYYHPSIGRFTQPDPFAGALAIPASLNPYGYTYGNPVNYVDPSGEFICGGLCLAAAVVVIAGGIALTADYAVQSHENMQAGMNFWDAAYYQNHNWGRTASVTGEAMAFAAIGLTVGWGLGALGVTGFAAWATAGVIDVGLGTTWDMYAHGYTPSEAFLTNVIGFGIGEGVGYGLGRAARALGRSGVGDLALRDMDRLARAGMADETIDEVAARVRLVKETRARAVALTTEGNPLHLPNRQRGPVLSGATHPALDRVFFGQNHRTTPPNIHPLLQARLTYLRGYIDSRGGRFLAGAWEPPAFHSEVWALNEAILAREAQIGRRITVAELGEFMVHNRWLRGPATLQVARRCPHCHFLTAGVSMVGGN